MLPINLLVGSDIVALITVGFVLLVGALLVVALVRLIRTFLQQLKDSAALSLLGALQQDVASGEFARRMQEPKSLSGMYAVYGPQIEKDFPELNLDELKKRAENLAVTTLTAIDAEDFSGLSERSELYGSQVTSYLTGLQSVGEHEHFADVMIHRIVLSDYQKTAGTCRIGFELAAAAVYSRTDASGSLVAGGAGLTQFKCSITALYIQDPSLVDASSLSALGFNCPNCGAPVGTLGDRTCGYCGSAVEPLNSRVWTFSGFGLSI